MGFFVVPPILRGQIEKRLSEQLHRHVTVGKVALNPLTLSMTLESFSIAEPAGGQFIGWKRLFVDFDSFSVLLREWRFQEIVLDGFSGKVAIDADGRVNFADLLETVQATIKSSAKTTRKPWPLLVRQIAIGNARLSYSDASQAEPFATEVGPTTVSLKDFHIGGPRQAPGEFSATTESGETVTWRGALSLVPLWSKGDLMISKIALKKYAPYYRRMVHFDLHDGRLDLALHYDFSIENGVPALRVSNGHLLIEALQIAKRGAIAPVVALKQIEVTGMAATYPKISAEAARVAVTGGSVLLQRTPAGIDLVELLMPVLPPAKSAAGMASAPTAVGPSVPIEANVAEISLRDLTVTVEDLTTPRPARHELTGLTCDLRSFSLASPATPVPFGLKARLVPEGEVQAAGTVSLAPMKVALTLELTNISLANVSPYAEPFANLRITRGGLSAALNVYAELPTHTAPVLAAQGDVTIEDFAACDETAVDQFVGWHSLAIKGLEFASDPAKLLISEVTWVEPSGRLIVNADGSINLLVALRVPGAPPPLQVSMPVASRGKPTAPAIDQMTVALDRFVLENASCEFIDRAIKPNVRLSLNELTGTIEGLASAELARASVDIRGKVNDSAPVSISGKINPLSAQAFTDLKIAMKGIALMPTGPYSGKFAGYDVASGSLNLDIRCRVSQRKVDCTNVVTIDQFAFGEASNSPDATTLPVKLAVALLRDTSGRIVIDVPVQGSLDDPNFRIGRVVLRVITNLLVKVATSPFALIGSMFGGEKGQDLSYLQFVSGGTAPQDEAETKKLDIVAKALHGRPALNLEIVGGYDEVADGPVLRDQALEKEMCLLIWKDRVKLEPELKLEDVQVDPLQKMGMVRRMYYHTFPKEKPKTVIHTTTTKSNAPVSGQRGNLGAFAREKTTTSLAKTAPKKKPTPQSEAEVLADLAAGKVPEPVDASPLTLEEMKAILLERMTIDEESGRLLATRRAQTVYDYLTGPCQVPADRLTLTVLAADKPAAKGARVELRLK